MAGQLGTAERTGSTESGLYRFLLGTEEMGVCLCADWGYGFRSNVSLGENLRLREEWAELHHLLMLLPKDQRWSWDPETDTITLTQDGGDIEADFEANSKRLCTIIRFVSVSFIRARLKVIVAGTSLRTCLPPSRTGSQSSR